jgi:hypothetical protein
MQTKPKGDKNVDTNILCALLGAKADVSLKNLEGNSPLDLADDDTIKQFMIK